MTSYKRLFTRSLSPDRLHLAAHSHHPRPDATRDAQLRCWDDAAALLDKKWPRVFEVWARAQAGVAAELALPDPNTIVFAPNTHDFLLRIASALPRRPLRILATDGEFHSFRRQAERWAETGEARLDIVPLEPFATFEDRLFARAAARAHDLIFVSHVFFGTGRVFTRAFELAAFADPEGPFVVIDGYHGFMALPTDLSAAADRVFYLSGAYKYAMAGEGAAFLHCPPGFGPRPAATGWYAEFADLVGPPGGVRYAADAQRFMGATFDPSGVYRLAAVFDLLAAEGLDTPAISARCANLKARLHRAIADGAAGALRTAEAIDPEGPARFLALRSPRAPAWAAALAERGATVDVRGEVLRLGLGLYHDPEDIARFCEIARTLPD